MFWLLFFGCLVWSLIKAPSALEALEHATASPKPMPTLGRVNQQKQLLKAGFPVISLYETRLIWLGVILYLAWSLFFANLPQHLFHALIIMHILLNSKGKWASLSSTFKYDGNKMYPVALLFGFRLFGLLSPSLRFQYASSPLSAALRILIFLHETDAKLGHAAHMAFVYAALMADGYDLLQVGAMPPEVLWSLLCGGVYVLCSPWSGLRERNVRQLVLNKLGGGTCPDRDVEYVNVPVPSPEDPETVVRLYFNLSHYTVHRDFSAVSVLCELVLLSSSLR